MDSAVVERLEELRGATVTQMRVDHGFTLMLAPPDVAMPASLLLIGGAFSCRDSTGDEHVYVDDHARGSLGPALELLFNQEVAAASASESGELTLDFVSGARMRVPPHTHFEAWSLSARGIPTLVSPPGGGWPVWPIKEYGSADS
jgi:Family of unknown function (DUF6188)